jgi:membrane protein YqaA with SNARE-associated domain
MQCFPHSRCGLHLLRLLPMATEIIGALRTTFGGVPARFGLLDPLQLLTSFASSLPETVKLFIIRYTQFIWNLVEPLGSWAVFAVAGIDSAFFGFPLDPLVAGYIYRDNSRFFLYSTMAAAGSAAGSIILYVIGYKGGEVLLAKRISAAKFDRIRNSFGRHEFWALMFPSMMPPPFPFKLFVLAASVFEMNFCHFLLAIFAGRMVRFLILSVLVLQFGERAVAFVGLLIERHLLLLLVAFTVAAGIYVLLWFRSRRRNETRAASQ